MYVYAITGEVSINGEFKTATWLGFFQVVTPANEHNLKMKFLGEVVADFPIQYPLTLDNGVIIQEEDYYRGENSKE